MSIFTRLGVRPRRPLQLAGGCSLLVWLALPCEAAEVGQAPPVCIDASLKSPSAADFSNYRGKVLLIDFWATWCPPCRRSMPFLDSLRSELYELGLEVVAVNVDEETEQAKRYLAAHPVSYPILFDPLGKCPESFAINTMPSTYFVDRDGRIRFVHEGYRESDQAIIRAQARALLTE